MWIASSRPPNQPQQHAALHRGYTLIELLLVLVIVAILSAVALNWDSSIRVADAAAVRADLSRLVGALQEARAETGRYPVSSGFSTTPIAGLAFSPSPKVQFRVYGTPDDLSVYAVTASVRVPTGTCTIGLGAYDTGAGATCAGF